METLSLIFKVFWAPSEAMFLISKKPRVLAPLLLLCLVALGTSIFTFTHIDMGEVMLSRLERSGQTLSEEQRARIQQSSGFMAPGFVAFAALGTAILVTAAAAVYFGVFTLIGREAGFKAFYAVTAFAYLPYIFRNLVAALQVWTTPQSSLVMEELGSVSLAVFLDPTAASRLIYALASIVDVFAIWTLVLLIIGFKFLVRKSVGTPARIAGVLSVYLFFSAFGVLARMLAPR